MSQTDRNLVSEEQFDNLRDTLVHHEKLKVFRELAMLLIFFRASLM